jgi:hypothetical protein
LSKFWCSFSGKGKRNSSLPVRGCTDPAAINYDNKATVDDGSCYYDVCLNIDGNQLTTPSGYEQSGTSCLFPTPTCTVGNVSIGIGRSFTMTATFSNTASISLDSKSVQYTGEVTGSPGGEADNIAANGSRDFTTSSHTFVTTGDRIISWTLIYGTEYGNQSITCSGTVTITVAAPTCSVVNFDVSAGESFSPSVTVNNSNFVAAEIISATYTINPGGYTGVVPAPITNVPQQGPFTYNGSSVTIDDGGLYTLNYSVEWRISGAGGTISCPGSAESSRVNYEPYARFYGNDVIACGIPTSNLVRFSGGYSTSGPSGSNTYRGAASQLAVFAANQISGLMSGSQYSGRYTPWDLSFANNISGTTAITSLSFGGYIAACSNLAEMTIPMGIDGTINNLNNGTDSGIYEWGSPTIRGEIGGSKRIVVYANESITIGNNGGPNGNITYQNIAWAEPSQIPSFTLFVVGDIYIDESVTQLDGHYIATGDIYTCSSNGNPAWRDLTTAEEESSAFRTKSNFIINNCNKPLIVNGSFKANKIHFLRSRGTVRDGVPYELFDSPNIAEAFRFSPEIYLTNGGGINQNTDITTKFDSIVARPPAY